MSETLDSRIVEGILQSDSSYFFCSRDRIIYDLLSDEKPIPLIKINNTHKCLEFYEEFIKQRYEIQECLNCNRECELYPGGKNEK